MFSAPQSGVIIVVWTYKEFLSWSVYLMKLQPHISSKNNGNKISPTSQKYFMSDFTELLMFWWIPPEPLRPYKAAGSHSWLWGGQFVSRATSTALCSKKGGNVCLCATRQKHNCQSQSQASLSINISCGAGEDREEMLRVSLLLSHDPGKGQEDRGTCPCDPQQPLNTASNNYGLFMHFR